MKKRVVKVLAMLIAVISLISAFVFTSSAGDISCFDWQYTAVTNTIGKSGAEYYGLYRGSANDYLAFNAYCRGGPTASFKTSIYMYLSDSVNPRVLISKNSNTTGTRDFDETITKNTANYYLTAIGYVEFSCVSKTDSSDKWEANYRCVWVGETTGWREY